MILLRLTCLDFSEMRQGTSTFNVLCYPIAIGEQRQQKVTCIFAMGVPVYILVYLLKLLVKTDLC